MARQRLVAGPAIAMLIGLGARLAAQGSVAVPPPAWARITYLSGTMVYLEVGAQQGVREGTTFTVVHGDSAVAELTAKYISSTRTACVIARSAVTLVVGDSVRYVPAAAPLAAAGAVASGGASPIRRRNRVAPLRGRVGIRYLVIDQGAAGTLQQPSLDLRLDGNHIGGTPVGLAVDVRTQRTMLSAGSAAGATPPGLTRVYSAAVSLQRGVDGMRWAAGRQYAGALSPIGIFDGVAVDRTSARWSAGALAGTQPDAVTLSPSGATTEYGLWVQRHSAPGSTAPWSATAGAVGAYDRGQIDREFLYLRGTYSSRRFSFYASQEIDANRGWKRAVEGSLATFTATFATIQVNVSDGFSLSGGFDSRRSVRLYRDFINPEIAFDDAFRQGSWGEASIRVSRHLRASTDIRTSDGGGDGGSRAVTASFMASQLTALGLGVRARSTRYTGPFNAGMLTSLALEVSPGAAWRASVNGGVRTSNTPGSAAPGTTLTWAGADLDVALNRSVYLLLSTYRESGTPTASRQAYMALSWRF